MSTAINQQLEELQQMPSILETANSTGDFKRLFQVTKVTLDHQKSKTFAMTPDKMDRSSRRTYEEQMEEGKNCPYPLTEEEATPEVPRSEEIFYF